MTFSKSLADEIRSKVGNESRRPNNREGKCQKIIVIRVGKTAEVVTVMQKISIFFQS